MGDKEREKLKEKERGEDGGEGVGRVNFFYFFFPE